MLCWNFFGGCSWAWCRSVQVFLLGTILVKSSRMTGVSVLWHIQSEHEVKDLFECSQKAFFLFSVCDRDIGGGQGADSPLHLERSWIL